MAATDIGTITEVDSYTVSNRRYRIYDIQISSGANYTTGGMSLTPRQVGLNRIIGADPLGPAFSVAASTAFEVIFVYSTSKLMALATHATPGAAVADIEVTNNTNLSTFIARIKFEGT